MLGVAEAGLGAVDAEPNAGAFDAPNAGGFVAPNEGGCVLPALLLPLVAPLNLNGSDVFDDPVCPNEKVFEGPLDCNEVDPEN